LVCTTRPFSTVISWLIMALMAVDDAALHDVLGAAPGLTIWLPTSAATQTLLDLHLIGRIDLTSATSAKYPDG
jgi:hypothetical protein